MAPAASSSIFGMMPGSVQKRVTRRREAGADADFGSSVTIGAEFEGSSRGAAAAAAGAAFGSSVTIGSGFENSAGVVTGCRGRCRFCPLQIDLRHDVRIRSQKWVPEEALGAGMREPAQEP